MYHNTYAKSATGCTIAVLPNFEGGTTDIFRCTTIVLQVISGSTSGSTSDSTSSRTSGSNLFFQMCVRYILIATLLSCN